MEIHRIQSLLTSSLSEIQSAESFSERMEMVYNMLDREIPKTLEPAFACASTESFLDCITRMQIEPLLDIIKKGSETGQKYFVSDEELNKILNIVYNIVE